MGLIKGDSRSLGYGTRESYMGGVLGCPWYSIV